MRVLMCNTNLSPAILASSAYSGQEIRPDKVFNDVDINENAKLMKDYDTDGNFLKFSIQEFKELTADRQVNFIRDLLDYSTAFGTTNDALTEEGFKALIDLITIFNNSNDTEAKKALASALMRLCASGTDRGFEKVMKKLFSDSDKLLGVNDGLLKDFILNNLCAVEKDNGNGFKSIIEKCIKDPANPWKKNFLKAIVFQTQHRTILLEAMSPADRKDLAKICIDRMFDAHNKDFLQADRAFDMLTNLISNGLLKDIPDDDVKNIFADLIKELAIYETIRGHNGDSYGGAPKDESRDIAQHIKSLYEAINSQGNGESNRLFAQLHLSLNELNNSSFNAGTLGVTNVPYAKIISAILGVSIAGTAGITTTVNDIEDVLLQAADAYAAEKNNTPASDNTSSSTHTRTTELVGTNDARDRIKKWDISAPDKWPADKLGEWTYFLNETIAPILGVTKIGLDTNTELKNKITTFATALMTYDANNDATVTAFNDALKAIVKDLGWNDKYLNEHILCAGKAYLISSSADFTAQIAAHGGADSPAPSPSVFDLDGNDNRLTIGNMIEKGYLKKDGNSYTLTPAGMANRLKNFKNEFAHGAISLPLYEGKITSLNVPSNIGASDLHSLAGKCGVKAGDKPFTGDDALNTNNPYHKIAGYILQKGINANKNSTDMWCFEIAVDGQTYEIRVPKREGDVEEKVLLAALRRENEAVAGLAIWKKDAATSEQVAVPAKEEGGGIQVNPDGAPDNLPPIPTDVLGSELAISDTDAPNDTVTIGGKPYKVTLEITTPPANTRIKLAPVEQTGENQPPSYTLELQQDNAWKVVSPPPAA